MREVREFYSNLEKFTKDMKKRLTHTVSDEAFKNTAKNIFTEWKTNVKPQIEQCKLFDKSKVDDIDHMLTVLYDESKKRVSETDQVISLLTEASELLFRYVLIPSKTTKTLQVHTPQREDLVKRLNLKTKHFTIASDYFEEAKSCFGFGFFRASTIVAISALESCLKTDFYQIKGRQFNGKLFNLLNRYFSGDLKRLPKQYEDFSKTYVKIRNSFTHPEEFDYSETIVFNVLSTVMELIRAIEDFY